MIGNVREFSPYFGACLAEFTNLDQLPAARSVGGGFVRGGCGLWQIDARGPAS